MSRSVLLKCKGIFTNPNNLGSIPDGALSIAENIVVDRDDIAEPRRGFAIYGDALAGGSNRTKQLLSYEERVIRHYASRLEYDDATATGTFSRYREQVWIYGSPVTAAGTTVTFNTPIPHNLVIGDTVVISGATQSEYNGTFTVATIPLSTSFTYTALSAPGVSPATGLPLLEEASFTINEVEAGTKLKYVEVSGNLFLTSFNGIYKIDDVESYATKAGGKKALDLQLSLTNSSGFFTQGTQVAYRIVWGIKDVNNNLILGTPSERVVITNPIEYLLARDVNTALLKLDADTGVTDTNYYSLYKLTSSATSAQIYTNLKGLCDKLNLDAGVTDTNYSAGQTAQVTTISTIPTASITTNGAYFILYDEIGTRYNCYYDKTGGIAAPVPNPGVGTNIEIDLFTGTPDVTAEEVAQTTAAAINAISSGTKFSASVIGKTVVVTNKIAGQITDPSNFNLDSPFSVVIDTLGEDYDSSSGSDVQEAFNTIIAKLNADATVSDSNYVTASQSQTVKLMFTIPQGITTNHFYQVYRTALSTGIAVDPGDEQGLVYEANPTGAEISAKLISITDITPDTFRGANLYTNANSGEGIAQANDAPPFAKDITLYKNSIFYANTKTLQKKSMALLGISGLISGTSTFKITSGATTLTYTFATKVAEITTVTTVADVAGNLASKYFTINSGTNATQYYVWFKASGVGTDPAISGKTGILVNITNGDLANTVATAVNTKLTQYTYDFTTSVLANVVTITNVVKGVTTDGANGTSGFTVTVTTQGAGENTSGNFVSISDASTSGQQVDETARSLVRIINRDSGNNLVYAYYVSGPDDVPGKFYLEAKDLSVAQFFIHTNSTITSALFNPVPGTTAGNTTVFSDNEQIANRVYFSKFQQGEAVPASNYIELGARNKVILRILALRDSVFVLKEDGVFRITGDVPSGLSAASFDNSTSILAPESAAIGNNQIYALTTQGVATISDTGTQIISRSIENLLLSVFPTSTTAMTNFTSTCFGVFYETERKYLLFLISDTADTVATQSLVFNSFTNTWTKWTISKTAALINSSDNKLYLGAADTNFIERERKTYTFRDQADREIANTIISVDSTSLIITLGSTTNVAVGDILSQVGVTSTYEVRITAVDIVNNQITIAYESMFEAGACSIFKAISCHIQWVPQHGGDPSVGKHFREGTFIFSDYSFNLATVGFSSDIIPAFSEFNFSGNGTGAWGTFSWGSLLWGGAIIPKLFRTYVTRNHQRSRELNCKFRHSVAYEKFSLNGLSLTFEVISEKVSK